MTGGMTLVLDPFSWFKTPTIAKPSVTLAGTETVSTGPLEWVAPGDFDHTSPHVGENMWICKTDDVSRPGKYFRYADSGTGYCAHAFNWKENLNTSGFKVLKTDVSGSENWVSEADWDRDSATKIGSNGGFDMYICLAQSNEGEQPGKYYIDKSNNAACVYPLNGEPVDSTEFKVLQR